MPEKTKKEQVLDLAARKGVLHARDVKHQGLHSEYLRRLCSEGLLVRTGRARYELPENDISAFHSFAEVAQAVPGGVLCLLSALRFHDIGTQAPFEVWTAIKRRSRAPHITSPKVRVVFFSGPAFSEGIGAHTIEGVPVRIYSPAKTVADCFKYLYTASESGHSSVSQNLIPWIQAISKFIPLLSLIITSPPVFAD